jgi:hypothetical protein
MVNIDTYAIDIRLLQTKTWLLNVQLRVRGLRLEQKRLRITESELTLGEILCVGNWFKDKSQNSNRNPTCNPETDKICMAPAYW